MYVPLATVAVFQLPQPAIRKGSGLLHQSPTQLRDDPKDNLADSPRSPRCRRNEILGACELFATVGFTTRVTGSSDRQRCGPLLERPSPIGAERRTRLSPAHTWKALRWADVEDASDSAGLSAHGQDDRGAHVMFSDEIAVDRRSNDS